MNFLKAPQPPHIQNPAAEKTKWESMFRHEARVHQLSATNHVAINHRGFHSFVSDWVIGHYCYGSRDNFKDLPASQALLLSDVVFDSAGALIKNRFYDIDKTPPTLEQSLELIKDNS